MSDRVHRLETGRWSAMLDGVTLRSVKWDGSELLKAIEVTVRDRHWGTAPARIDRVRLQRRPGAVAIALKASYATPEVGLDADVWVTIGPGPELSVSLDARATKAFRRNRIGLVALLPMDAAGHRVTFSESAGARPTTLPSQIDPAVVATGLTGLRWDAGSGLEAALSLRGERWEIEDQRNWTDASFKVYPTPLSLPFPVLIQAGSKVNQAMTLSVRGRPRRRTRPAQDVVEIGPAGRARIPAIGSELPGDVSLDEPTVSSVRALGLRHIRSRLDSDDPAALDTVLDVARAIGVPVQLDVIVGDGPPDSWETLGKAEQIEAVFAFDARTRPRDDTTSHAVELVRERTRRWHVPVGGGTRANFTELNRLRPDPASLDLGTYSINPQVHAFDEASILETVDAVALTVRDAGTLLGHLPLSVVMSLRPRFNPVSHDAPTVDPAGRPLRADPRQGSRFAAVWALATVRTLAHGGVRDLTIAETHGPAGLIDDSNGGPRSSPMAALVADLTAVCGAPLVSIRTPPGIVALGVRHGSGTRLWIANASPASRSAPVRTDPGLRWRTLRATPWPGRLGDGWRSRRGSLMLGPWGIAAFDVGTTDMGQSGRPWRGDRWTRSKA